MKMLTCLRALSDGHKRLVLPIQSSENPTITSASKTQATEAREVLHVTGDDGRERDIVYAFSKLGAPSQTRCGDVPHARDKLCVKQGRNGEMVAVALALPARIQETGKRA